MDVQVLQGSAGPTFIKFSYTFHFAQVWQRHFNIPHRNKRTIRWCDRCSHPQPSYCSHYFDAGFDEFMLIFQS
jgi:hypothetical protein